MKTSRNITIALHVIIWSAVLGLPYVFTSPESHYGQIGLLVCNFFTLANLLHIGLFYFNAFFLYSRFLTRKRWWIYVLSVAVLIVVIYHGKLFIINLWFPDLAKDESVFAFTFFPIVFFLVISTIYRLVLDKINSEKTQLATELKFLRSQVSPHFLFNVLNNLVSMARHKSDLLEPSLIKLSGLMRYMLYEANESKVSTAQEIDYIKNYIELQKMRFGDDIDIRTTIEDEGKDYVIEPMLLIPLVENAFKHGVSIGNNQFISVELTKKAYTLSLRVKNSFVKEDSSKDNNSGIGLNNLRSRLKLLYPQRHVLAIDEHSGVFSANLTITLR
jgi:sensor histidine kinase YesM